MWHCLPCLHERVHRERGSVAAGAIRSTQERLCANGAAKLHACEPPGGHEVRAALPCNNPAAQAVIFAPNETPYACGAFAFDILLPPEYPNRPPQVRLHLSRLLSCFATRAPQPCLLPAALSTRTTTLRGRAPLPPALHGKVHF